MKKYILTALLFLSGIACSKQLDNKNIIELKSFPKELQPIISKTKLKKHNKNQTISQRIEDTLNLNKYKSLYSKFYYLQKKGFIRSNFIEYIDRLLKKDFTKLNYECKKIIFQFYLKNLENYTFAILDKGNNSNDNITGWHIINNKDLKINNDGYIYNNLKLRRYLNINRIEGKDIKDTTKEYNKIDIIYNYNIHNNKMIKHISNIKNIFLIPNNILPYNFEKLSFNFDNNTKLNNSKSKEIENNSKKYEKFLKLIYREKDKKYNVSFTRPSINNNGNIDMCTFTKIFEKKENKKSTKHK